MIQRGSGDDLKSGRSQFGVDCKAAAVIPMVLEPSTASGQAQQDSHLDYNPIDGVVIKKEFYLAFSRVSHIDTRTSALTGDYLRFRDAPGSVLLEIPCGNHFPNFDILLPALRLLCPNAH